MPAETYELVALGFRYWFVLLVISIVIRAYRWAMQDHRRLKRTLKALPDAGLVGEIVNLNTGESQVLPREGVLGSGKSSDVYYPGLRKCELEFIYVEKQGVCIFSRHRNHQILLQNESLDKVGYALHGSRLNMPGYHLRFRLFSGLNLPELDANAQHFYQNISTGPDNFNMELLADAGMPTEISVQQTELGTIQPQSIFDSEPNSPDIKWNPQLTWKYAPPPADFNPISGLESTQQESPIWEQSDYTHLHPDEFVRKRRSKRHEH